MNIVNKYIDRGLSDWEKIGAKVIFLETKKFSVPVIFLKSKKNTNLLIILASGFHLEETSGPTLLLSPRILFPVLKPHLNMYNYILFPVINQRGLKYKESLPDKYLRFNAQGINYNSCWGTNSKKPIENQIVEKEILKLFKEYKITFALSLHEDSTEPGNGYLWMNKIVRKLRNVIQQKMLKSPYKRLLKMNSTIGFRKGQIEGGFTIVDAKDDSFENFMSEILGVPTLLSEAPFALDPTTRKSFHLAVIKSALSSLLKQF